MYRVVIYNSATGVTIHEPTEDPNDPHLYECKLVQGISGEIDSLSFKILPNNPGYDQLNCYTTMIEVIDTTAKPESAEFVGRVLTVAPNMEESGLVYKSVVCEDRLGYLCDSVQPYVEEQTYYGDSEKTGVQKFLELLLENHNSQVEDAKKIYPGTISFNTSSGNVTKGLNYQTTWDAIREKLLNSLGGEIQLYSFDGKLYLDYVASLGTTGEQVIEVAKNMRTATQDESPSEIITRLIPLGDYKDQESDSTQEYERINISSVNGGKLYIDDDDAIKQYGIIEGTVIWEDVTLPENLYEKGQEWLQDQTVEDSLTLSAYDLYLAGIDPDQIIPSNWYEVKNPLIGLDRYYRCVKRTTNVCDPVDKTYEMGAQNKSLALSISSNSQTAKDAADAAAAINANLSKTVNTLIAGNALILYLEATVADIEYAYIDRAEVEELLTNYATINYLEAYYMTAEYIEARYLSADSAVITDLTSFAANIYTLLGGEGAFGELQSIHLTTDNAVIDDAVIMQALIGTVLADIINSNVIYTDQITIMSEDGGITIIGNQIQVVEGQLIFYDENGNIRMQIGQDASGAFSFILYDETGTGVMIDSEGVHASAIPDGLIVDAMVAQDANISADKINMQQVTDYLNESGDLVLNAYQIAIDGETLDYKLTEMTEMIEGINFDGLITFDTYFCLWPSSVDPPVDEADFVPAYTDEAETDYSYTDLYDYSDFWTLDEPQGEDGMYIWVRYLCYYNDGHTEWSDPYCITDDFIRKQTTVLQTQLEVVEGQISEKIWMSDITEAIQTTITDYWAEINLWLGEIEEQVGLMSSTVDSLTIQVATQDMTINGITNTVMDITTHLEDVDLTSVTTFDTYFCLWASATEPPIDEADFAPAYTDEALTDYSYTDLYEYSELWSLDEPQTSEGLYKWVRYLLYYRDGHTEWSDPYCVTDEYNRATAEGAYSQIVQLADSITLSVTGMLGGVAQIKLTVDQEEIEQDLDLSAVRMAFANDDSEVMITAGLINFASNTIVINSDNLTVTQDGSIYATNAYLSGQVEASKGHIGNWIIGTNKIYNDLSVYEKTAVMQAPSDNMTWVFAAGGDTHDSYGECPFRVSKSGAMYAASGKIAEWEFGDHYMRGGSESLGTTAIVQVPRESSSDSRYWVFAAGGHDHSDHSDCLFRVGSNGDLYAQEATFSGVTYFKDTGIAIAHNTPSGGGIWFYLYNSSSYRYFIGLNEAYVDGNEYNNAFNLGNPSYPTIMYSSRIWVMGCALIIHDQGIALANGYGVYHYLYNSTSFVKCEYLDTSNRLNLGNADYVTILRGSSVYLNGTSTAVTSDRKLKSDIEPLSNQYDSLIDSLAPRAYTVDAQPDEKHIGFVVDEVETAMKEAGLNPADYGITDHFEDDGEDIGAIRYEEIIPILVYEIQNLKKQINEMKGE